MAFLHVKLPESCTAPLRLDKYIASLQDGMNRSKLKAGVHEILINGKHGKLSSKVAAGDEIDIEWEDNIPDNIAPENIALRIVYEDDDVLVSDKTQGMVTHPACGNWSGTLVNALLYHLHADAIPLEKHATQSEMLASRRPGIVHRLDKDTSGVIIAAKCRDAETWLCAQFKERCVQKSTLLLCRESRPHSQATYARRLSATQKTESVLKRQRRQMTENVRVRYTTALQVMEIIRLCACV